MSEDENVILYITLAVGLYLWIRWFFRIFSFSRFASPRQIKMLLSVSPILCAIVLFIVLKLWSSHDVRNDPRYLMFYMIMGSVSVGLFPSFLELFGLSAFGDALRRNNLASCVAVAGALIGATFSYAGANIGSGPGWWVVVFCAFLSTCSLFVIWILVAVFTDCVDHIKIDRDISTGVRIAGLLIGSGIILGVSVAGDWVSMEQTIVDFVITAPPVLVLLVLEIIAGRAFKPTPERPNPAVGSFGMLPAWGYIVFAMIYAFLFGGLGTYD